jgi:hypothetical protein
MSSSSHINIVPFTIEHRQSAINLLIGSFFVQEPLNATLKFDLPHEPLSWTEHRIDNALRDQCSFVAIDTASSYQDIVGVILNGITHRDIPDETPVTSSEKLNFIMSLLDKMGAGHDLWQRFDVDRLFHCDILNIDEKQRGHNLSGQLIAKSIEKARQIQIQGMFVICSSLFSRKAFLRHDFQVINEIFYEKYDHQRLNDMGIHDRCTLLAKQL